jgi:hypothetical protein
MYPAAPPWLVLTQPTTAARIPSGSEALCCSHGIGAESDSRSAVSLDHNTLAALGGRTVPRGLCRGLVGYRGRGPAMGVSGMHKVGSCQRAAGRRKAVPRVVAAWAEVGRPAPPKGTPGEACRSEGAEQRHAGDCLRLSTFERSSGKKKRVPHRRQVNGSYFVKPSSHNNTVQLI